MATGSKVANASRHGPADVPFDDGQDAFDRHRRQPVEQTGQLLAVGDRQQVVAHGEELAQLGEHATAGLQVPAQQDRGRGSPEDRGRHEHDHEGGCQHQDAERPEDEVAGHVSPDSSATDGRTNRP